jgi:hypothetical protein
MESLCSKHGDYKLRFGVQLGRLPGALRYVSRGTQCKQIDEVCQAVGICLLHYDTVDPKAKNFTTIYSLCDPRSGAVRYIGKADQPCKRLRAHVNERADRRKNRWINQLKSMGLEPELRILEVVPSDDWETAERHWIAHYRDSGADLTNHTDGGEGLHNASESTRQKLREIKVQEWQRLSPAERAFRVRDPDRCKRISESLRGRPRPGNQYLPQNQPGFKVAAERAEFLREMLRRFGYRPPKGVFPKQFVGRHTQWGNSHTLGRVMPDHEKLQRSLRQKGRAKSLEHREKMRLGALRRWKRQREDIS